MLAPEPTPTGRLFTGQVGYVVLGIKTTKAARVGDTLHAAKKPVPQLPGFRPAKSMVYAGEGKGGERGGKGGVSPGPQGLSEPCPRAP